MNSTALEPATCKPQWWLFILALVFVSQLLLIYLLSGRERPSVRPAPARMSIQLFTGQLTESEFSKIFLASDPTLFARASPHGFSGAAWLSVPERNYDLSQRTESPFWLALNSENLGDVVTRFVRTNVIAPLSLAEISAPKILISPILDLPSGVKSNSQFRVEGDLRLRELIEVPKLQSWATNGILSNTVVQIAVDGRGAVVSPRLLSRSGSADADRSALDTARNVQFVPNGKNETTWGKLIFDWHSIPAATTNGVARGSAP
jgi:TonB family protein